MRRWPEGPEGPVQRLAHWYRLTRPPHLWGGGLFLPTCGEVPAKPAEGRARRGHNSTASSLIPLHPTRHLLLRLDDATLELGRADHSAAHAPHQVALKAVRGGDGDDLAPAAGTVSEPLDRVVRRVALAREHDAHAFHGLLRVGHRRRVMRVEHDGH